MKIVIEVQECDGKKLQKLSLNHDSLINIGRSWQSDVIVQDTCVDETHLQLSLDEQGQVLIVDLESKNGAFIANKQIKGEIPYSWGEAISIGSTLLRIFDTNQAVKPAFPISVWQTLSQRLSNMQTLSLTTLALVITIVLQALIGEGKEFRFLDFLPTIFGLSIALLIWSLLMGFVGRLFRHEVNAKAHWGFCCVLMIVVVIVGYLLEIIQFNISTPLFQDISGNIFFAVIIALFVYGTLSFASFLGHQTKLVWSLLFAVLPATVFFVMPLFEEEHEKWSYWVHSTSVSMPPALLVSKPQSLEGYMQEVDELFEILNEKLED